MNKKDIFPTLLMEKNGRPVRVDGNTPDDEWDPIPLTPELLTNLSFGHSDRNEFSSMFTGGNWKYWTITIDLNYKIITISETEPQPMDAPELEWVNESWFNRPLYFHDLLTLLHTYGLQNIGESLINLYEKTKDI